MRFNGKTLVVAATLAGLLVPAAASAEVILFQNNFEAPTGIVIPFGCCGDASQQQVNTLYGTSFQQTFTVETLSINGPQGVYDDPSGIGGNYALGMLSSVQNDLLSLTFNTAGLPFINLGWDIAAVGIDQPAGLPSTPTFLDFQNPSTFRVTLYNTPGGVFNINTLGLFTALDAETVVGELPLSGGLTFGWSHHVVGLSTAGATDGNVTLLIDLTVGGYAAFDNMLITASEVEGDPTVVPEPATLLLFGGGLAAGVWKRRARRCPTSCPSAAASQRPAG